MLKLKSIIHQNPACKSNYDEVCNCLDQLEVMQSMEENYVCCDYSKVKGEVDEDCRKKMVEWCFQVADFFDVDKETVIIGLSYVDVYIGKFLDKTVLNDKKRYQLLVMTSLYVATKVYETKIIGVGLLMDLGKGTYLREEFLDMERDLISVLRWRLNPPTATSFVRQLLLIAAKVNIDDELKTTLEELSCMQIEKSLHKLDVTFFRPSTIAVCAILNALKQYNSAYLHPPKISNDMVEMLRVCNLNLDQREIEVGRILLGQGFFPISTSQAQVPPASPQYHAMYTSTDSIRYSPVCVDRQTQHYL